jgi:hypothetical protein
MGRLEDIIDRNKNPGKHRKMRFPLGLMMAGFVLLILVLMIFTDLDESPGYKAAPATGSGEQRVDGDKRVDGVLLYRERTHRDAGVDR